MDKFLLISAGAILGANSRYWLSDWIARKWGAAFPYGTLVINLTGSLVIGFFMTLAANRLMIDTRWRLLFVTGFLGAYTTFSTYAFESFALLTRGQWGLGLLNLAGSTLLGVGAVALGAYLANLV